MAQASLRAPPAGGTGGNIPDTSIIVSSIDHHQYSIDHRIMSITQS